MREETTKKSSGVEDKCGTAGSVSERKLELEIAGKLVDLCLELVRLIK